MTRRDRLYGLLVLGGVVAVAVLIVLIFQFGRHKPSPPSLAANPNISIPGTIVYFDHDGCIVRADASGANRKELYCEAESGPGFLTWVDAKTVAFARFDSPTPVWILVDIETGKATGTTVAVSQYTSQYKGFHFPGQNAISSLGESVSVDQRDGKVFRIVDGIRTEIADFDVREYGGPNIVTWSPDGQWILLQYYPPRNNDGRNELWILSRDGAVRGTLATDARGSPGSWWIDGLGFLPAVEGLPAK